MDEFDRILIDAIINMKLDGIKSDEADDNLLLKYMMDLGFKYFEEREGEYVDTDVMFIKYMRDIKPIEESDKGDWIDLRSGVDIDLDIGESAVIPLGVCIQLPKGYEAIIAPRSSTFKKWGIIQTNSIGVIDESYKGDNDEWCLPVLALRKTHIYKNDRICQFRLIEHQPFVEMKKVKVLNNPDRKGFGSTGNN